MRLLILLLSLGVTLGIFGQQKYAVFERSDNDSILIHSNVNDHRVKIIIDSIILTGNKVTKRQIILRELTFRTTDTIPAFEFSRQLTRSRENLLNTSLFNFVTVRDSVITQGNFAHVHLKFNFIERWYLWPIPIFEISDRNFNTWWRTKDLNRISYGLLLVKENMRGRKEKLNMLLRFGYDETYQISYDVPYINVKQTFGAGFGLGYEQKHEVAYETYNNHLEHFKDEDHSVYKKFYSFLRLSHRPSLYQNHAVQFNYNYYRFADTLLALNPDYSFGGETVNEFLTLMYRFSSDHRDSRIYPLKGSYFEGTLSKSGFGIFKDGNISMMELSGSYRHYWQLSKRFHFGTDWTGKISTSRDQPYFYQRGLGFGRTFVRGYELYVIDGQSYILSKNTLKFSLIPTRVKTLNFIKTEKFNKLHYAVYLNWFIDAGYVDDFKHVEGNELANDLMLGTGLGLDLVTYYDIVLRVEGSFNKEGEFGFFFHVASTL